MLKPMYDILQQIFRGQPNQAESDIFTCFCIKLCRNYIKWVCKGNAMYVMHCHLYKRVCRHLLGCILPFLLFAFFVFCYHSQGLAVGSWSVFLAFYACLNFLVCLLRRLFTSWALHAETQEEGWTRRICSLFCLLGLA